MKFPPLERLRAARLQQQRRCSDLDALLAGSLALHSTDYWSPYLSAWARIPGFQPAALLARLNAGQGLVRINCLRNTVHVVRTHDLALFLAATGEAVGAVGRRSPGLRGYSDLEIRRGLDALMAALADGPKGINELKAALPDQAEHLRFWLLLAMGEGHILRADAAHARSNRTRYALTGAWISGFQRGELSASEARRQLLGRAVRAFGPITVADLAWWLPAPKGEVARALASCGAELMKIEDQGETWWCTAELADATPAPREALGAWLLPYEDGLLKAYLDRSWCLAPGLREVIFPFSAAHWRPPAGSSPGPGPHKGVNVSGEARPSIWWGGRVVGRWELEPEGVAWQLHGQVSAEGEEAIRGEITRIERFIQEELAPIS